VYKLFSIVHFLVPLLYFFFQWLDSPLGT
jgi:hypothetical protein